MKEQMTSYLRTWAMVAFCVTLIVIAMGVGRNRQSRVAVMGGEQEDRFLYSATEIVRLPGGNPATDSDIARLDTRTGAIYRFRGNVNVASVQNTWELRVAPVKESHSGLLEIQNILPARPIEPGNVPVPFKTFYVDTLTGETVQKVETQVPGPHSVRRTDPNTGMSSTLTHPQVNSVPTDGRGVDVVRPVTFLVDIVNGTTWILRTRASTNASWELIDIYRSAQFH
jgi:hypothetical protein